MNAATQFCVAGQGIWACFVMLKSTKNYLTLNIPPLSCPSATTSLGVPYVVVAAVVRTHLDFFLLTNRQHKATGVICTGSALENMSSW